MCKVRGCSEKHRKHFCKICGDNDSGHRSTNCTGGGILTCGLCGVINNHPTQNCPILARPVALSQVKKSCGLPGCTENHQIHYCKVCKTNGSDHISKLCPSQVKQSCGLPGCTDNHKIHYCKVCRTNGSGHISKFCPSKLSSLHPSVSQLQRMGLGFNLPTRSMHATVAGRPVLFGPMPATVAGRPVLFGPMPATAVGQPQVRMVVVPRF